MASLLTASGIVILSLPRESPVPTASSATPSAAISSIPPADTPTPPTQPRAPSPAADPNSATAGPPPHQNSNAKLPPHGDGASGDPAIQQALETAWPADLSPADEQKLRKLATSLLRADATGVGRAGRPDVFQGQNQAVAPAFALARFRIQGVVARRDGAAGRAVVHLVWAGADRGGTFTDGRITDLHFIRSITKGVVRWSPTPRH
ncbi:hypothetical protein [Streptomyces sp. NPDC048643]|uniref:hypothetical protein n=1 Tax=Streptomyces sp. NPDC048643 TaxID=3155637 RepID=UPI003448526F